MMMQGADRRAGGGRGRENCEPNSIPRWEKNRERGGREEGEELSQKAVQINPPYLPVGQ
jgi:hypothetical protein